MDVPLRPNSVWAVLAAQAVKEKSGFELFWATFEGGFFNFLWAKRTFVLGSYEHLERLEGKIRDVIYFLS